MPSLTYFQLQREGMGNESMVYSFISIAKCDEVCQWGFDETGLNGIPALNQWCRIKENGEYRTVTIECAGLLPGSTSTRVAEHSHMGMGTIYNSVFAYGIRGDRNGHIH